MMYTIILTRGIQGSGKSTWAKEWVAEDSENRIRINFDDLRNMMGNYKVENWKLRETIINDMFVSFMKSAMENHYGIVVDNMNLSDSAVNRVEKIIEEYNKNHREQYTYEFKNFFTDVNECIARDKKRLMPIGEDIIRKTWRTYRHKILQIQNNEFVDSLKSSKYSNNPELPNCIIADMDSTICFNTQGRPYFGKDAGKFMMDDIPNLGVIDIIRSFLRNKNGDDKVFIITGRERTPEIERATLDYVDIFISEHPDIIVLFRPNKEYMSGDDMKMKLIDENILGKYNILYAIDDSDKIVKRYRQNGILTLQCV